MKYVLGETAGRKLIDAGLLPRRTVDFELVMGKGKVVMLRSAWILTDAEYKKVLRLLAVNVDARKVISLPIRPLLARGNAARGRDVASRSRVPCTTR